MGDHGAAYWQSIATERLRVIWLMTFSRGGPDQNGGKVRLGRSVLEQYPGDDRAQVLTHTDPIHGDFVIEARTLKE